ncbi:MAG: uL15 family ribosomal protein [Candidatus Paceibacterota bacterium]|jgi:large subunit ribosomal protein L15
MQIHTLRPAHARRAEKRIGRGGKRGAYSGRGQKGQKSRAGHNIRPGLRDVLIRTPKLRGYANKPVRAPFSTIATDRLNAIKDERIDRALLIKHKIIRAKELPKIVAGKALTSAKIVVEIPCTATARALIEKAGGKIVTKA